jgi:hypothetical protein
MAAGCGWNGEREYVKKAKPADLKAGFARMRETSDSLDAFYKAIIRYY